MRWILVPVLLTAWGASIGLAACGSSTNETSGDGGPDARADGHPAPSDAGKDAVSDAHRADARHDGGAADAAKDGPFVMAKHPPLPLLVNSGAPGPGVLTAPEIVTVTFPGDPMVDDLEKLGSGIAASAWWDAVRPGYCDGDGGPCIGDGPPGVAVRLTSAPAKSYNDSQIQAFLKTQLDTGVLPAPSAGHPSQTIYVFYFPESTTVHYGGTSCNSFFGYHGAMPYAPPGDAGVKPRQVTYAVVDECSVPQADGGVSPAQTLAFTTETASHEVMETASDPVNGFSLDFNDPSTWGWGDILGVENGDLCDWYGGPPNYPTWPGENVAYDATLTVQRIWSNPEVLVGGDPCLPIPPGVVFFEVAPPQNVFILDVGGSVTFDAIAYSTAPTSDWTVIAQDFTAASKPYLDISIAGATPTEGGPELKVNNGDKVKVTVKLLGDPGNTGNGEADGVFISYSGSADQPKAAYEWPFIVMTPADAVMNGIDASISKRPSHAHVPGSVVPRAPLRPRPTR